jgi:nucleotide-binding universal stress UspA family protein
VAALETFPIATMDKLIVASDGSKCSEGAVREAIELAKRYGSKLYAVCTAQVTLGQLEYAADVVSEFDKAAREACESVKSRAEAEGVDCEPVIHEGEEPYEHIVAEAENQQADAIIVGRRGRRGLMKLLMGSVTHLVIGHAPCKVLVVPKMGKLTAQRLLVATDGSEFSDKAVAEAISLAKRTGGSLIACSIAHHGINEDMANDHVNKVKDVAGAEGIKVETTIGHGNACQEIIAAAKAQDADMIVVGTHGRTGISKLLMGSIAERVVGMAETAVMVVR